MEPVPVDQVGGPGVLESARQHIRLLIGLTLAGLLLGLGLSLLQPTMYQGETHVILSPPSDAASSDIDANRWLLNQKELMSSVTVTDRAAKLSGEPIDGETLRKRLTTKASADRDLVVIQVLDPTARGASRLAEAVGRAYEQLGNEEKKSAAEALNASLGRLRTSYNRLTTQIADNPGDGSLRAQRDGISAQITELTTQYAAVQAGQGAGSTTLRENEPVPDSAAQPKTPFNMALGAMLGLIIGVATAWWLSGRSATKVLSSQETERLLGLPLLARLPVQQARKGDKPRLVMLDGSETVEGEAFRFLRTSFIAATRANKASVVMITSATEGEGKSMVAANLALALARTGVRVGLIDLDLRRPAQRGLLELPDGPGFTEVALGQVKLERALHRLVLVDTAWGAARRGGGGKTDAGNGTRHEVAFVEVLTAGSRPKGVGELVRDETTGDLIQKMRERVDVVLIDAPPMLRVGDALSLTAMVDALLVVARMKVVRRKALTELRRILETSGATLLGVVANGAASTETYTTPYGLQTKPAAVVHGSPASGGNGNGNGRTPTVTPSGAKSADQKK
jgi:Mrp family chromosome partitioning ATPase